LSVLDVPALGDSLMPYSIRIEGLEQVHNLLTRDFRRAVRAATDAIAQELEDVMSPYPPQTIANSPENPTMRWYERGYGPRWWVTGGALIAGGKGARTESTGAFEYLLKRAARERKRQARGLAYRSISADSVSAQARKGRIHGRKTSQMMNHAWHVIHVGNTSAAVVNTATYSAYLHSADKQARWAASRGWITDKRAIEVLEEQQVATRIVHEAVRKVLAKGTA
jgi:hypothetical protein